MPELKPSRKVGWGISSGNVRRVLVSRDMVPLVRGRHLPDLLNSVSNVSEEATSVVLDVAENDFTVRVELDFGVAWQF